MFLSRLLASFVVWLQVGATLPSLAGPYRHFQGHRDGTSFQSVVFGDPNDDESHATASWRKQLNEALRCQAAAIKATDTADHSHTGQST